MKLNAPQERYIEQAKALSKSDAERVAAELNLS